MGWDYFSNDGNAPRRSELMDCADCDNKVTCEDERTEFHAYLCEDCFQKRIENLELEDDNQLFV